jgi:hypothetical protein
VPVFADMDAETFALSPETVEAVLTPDVAGIVTVHIGKPLKLREMLINSFSRKGDVENNTFAAINSSGFRINQRFLNNRKYMTYFLLVFGGELYLLRQRHEIFF